MEVFDLAGGSQHPEERAKGRAAWLRIAAGISFLVLALAQAWFAYIFTTIVTVISQTDWYTINSRWVYPWVALVSCVIFARNAWRCLRSRQRGV